MWSRTLTETDFLAEVNIPHKVKFAGDTHLIVNGKVPGLKVSSMAHSIPYFGCISNGKNLRN